MNVRWLWILAPLLWSSAAFSDDIDDCNASGDYARAIKGCTSLIIGGNLNRRNAIRAFEHRASAYTETGNVDAAIADYTMVIEFDPKSELTYAFRGRLFGKRADYAAAITDLTKSLELKPGSLAYVDRAQIYEAMGDHARAIADYTKALELDAGSLFASRRDSERSLELWPGDPPALYARGQVLEALGRRDEAIADFQRALTNAPDYVEAKEALVKLGATPQPPNERDVSPTKPWCPKPRLSMLRLQTFVFLLW